MTPAAVPARPFFWLPPAALAAACAPSLLAYNVAPSATFLNQALALFFWGLVAAACAYEVRLLPDQRRRARQALVLPGLALALLLLAAVGSHLVGSLPRSLALSAAGTLAAAAVLLMAGAHAGSASGSRAQQAMVWFAAGWLMAGLLGTAIAVVQVLAPQWADGTLIARSGMVGRAIGNLRQPNHLCTLLLWAAIGVVALQELGVRLHRAAAALALLALAAGLVLSASRTAILGVLLMAVWGLADRRLSRPARTSLLAMPLLYALCWALLSVWARTASTTLGVDQRWVEPDVSSTRFAIWSDCLQLIRQHPWSGVGFGEFNFAWTLSVLPQRPLAFFDHAHNLLLHWAVELGLPAAAVLTLLLGACGLRMLLAVMRAPRGADLASAANPAGRTSDATTALRITLALLALMLLHSQLEYPLWYAYFLMPSMWLVGFGLAQAQALQQVRTEAAALIPQRKPAGRRGQRETSAPMLVLAGCLCALGAVAAVADYQKVAVIYEGQSDQPLQQRLQLGLASPLFAHQAAYAVATVSREPEREMDALRQAAHNLLDTRLMIAWAKAYAASGDLPRAHYLVARLREFRNPAAAEFLEPCGDPHRVAKGDGAKPEPGLPFQCQPADPRVALGWTHFR